MSSPAADPPAPPQHRAKRKRRKNTEFWRATAFLWPYRRQVVISVLAAIFVGTITTGGLAVMLPILRVLVNDDTIAGYVDRQIAEQRLGVGLSDEKNPHVIRLRPGKVGALAGLRVGDEITSIDDVVAGDGG